MIFFVYPFVVLKSLILFETDHGQTKPKPKPRGTKKLQKLTAVEHEGESKCLFRATNGKKKLSTVVRGKIIDLLLNL